MQVKVNVVTGLWNDENSIRMVVPWVFKLVINNNDLKKNSLKKLINWKSKLFYIQGHDNSEQNFILY